jgi:ankyrin repeat protein
MLQYYLTHRNVFYTLLLSLLLGCRSLSMNMMKNEDDATAEFSCVDLFQIPSMEHSEAAIIETLTKYKLLNNPDGALFWWCYRIKKNKCTEIAKWLIINKKVNINARDRFGNTILNIAIYRGHTLLAELLINEGANIHATDQNGMTPLHVSVFTGCTTVSELLVNLGADLNFQDTFGSTALHWATMSNRIDFFELLVIKTIDSRVSRLCALNNVESFNSFKSSSLFDRNLLQHILGYGDLEINIQNNQGKTPLDIAREKGDSQIVEILESIISAYTNQRNKKDKQHL